MFLTIIKDKKLIKRCMLTLFVLFVIRIFSSIPTPGVNTEYFKLLLEQNSSLNFLNALTGNGLSTLSVMTLSITPYITASIIMQLMGVIFKRIAEMQRGMEDERKIISRITIVLGVFISLMQGLGMSYGFGKQGMLIDFKWYWVLAVGIIWAVFAALLSVVGKYMTDNQELFIGNGISLILAMNIISAYPSDARIIWNVLTGKGYIQNDYILAAVIISVLFLIFLFTVFVQNCEKRIKIQYTAKVAKGESDKPDDYIPIKMCPGSVVPVIFASSLMTFPVIIAAMTGHGEEKWLNYLNSSSWFQTDHMIYSIGCAVYIFLIFAFTYYYTEITINPEEIAFNLQKNGGNIADIRSGMETAKYLRGQMKLFIGIGATALSIIALIPIVLSGVLQITRLSFLGTSIIITVGVILETGKDIYTQAMGAKYMNQVRKGGLFHA